MRRKARSKPKARRRPVPMLAPTPEVVALGIQRHAYLWWDASDQQQATVKRAWESVYRRKHPAPTAGPRGPEPQLVRMMDAQLRQIKEGIELNWEVLQIKGRTTPPNVPTHIRRRVDEVRRVLTELRDVPAIPDLPPDNRQDEWLDHLEMLSKWCKAVVPVARELITIEQAATLAKVTPQTVRRWIRDGHLPSHDKEGGALPAKAKGLRRMVHKPTFLNMLPKLHQRHWK